MVKTKPATLHVRMNGFLVGHLSIQSNGNLEFIYSTDWLNTPGVRPISLSMPLRSRAYTGDTVDNFFDNLLPDNDSIRKKILRRFQIAEDHPFHILNAIGHDCVGALQICSPSYSYNHQNVRYKKLSRGEVANILRACAQSPLGMLPQEADFRISIAGAQEKTALLFHENTWCLPTESTPTTHILKLPIGIIGGRHEDLSESCENEWLCLQIVKAFAIPVAHATIETFDTVKCLAVKRFDRQWSADGSWLMRIPQEDLCQSLGVSSQLKYQVDGGPSAPDCMNLLLGAENSQQCREQFLKSLLIFWILAAPDGHAKNFSIRLNADGRFMLTPLYDIISYYPLARKNLYLPKVKMAMAFYGKNTHYAWGEIRSRHFLSTAKRCGFSTARAEEILNETFEQVDSVISAVESIIPDGFPPQIADSIFDGMRKLKSKERALGSKSF